MCDILVATPHATKDGITLFAKNSDRDPNESQVLEYIPRKRHEEAMVKLTYVEFPQVEETYAIIISRPWWTWGAEMGANEFGLTIGNAALFTKERIQETGILGMDLVRLALERAKTSKEALDLIIEVVERHGQGGSGSYEHRMMYSNSFVVADPGEAWVLETAGRNWVAKRVSDVYSVSNAPTITNDWDIASKDFGSTGFADRFSDWFYTHFAHGRERRSYTYRELLQARGEITLEHMIRILRSHTREPYTPVKGSMKDICLHYGGLTRPTQTASSQVSELGRVCTHWFTACSLPCLSVFKPIGFQGAPDLGGVPTNRYDPEKYWWRIERFHRVFQTAYGAQMARFQKERDELQLEVMKAAKQGIEKRVSEWAFEREKEFVEKWEKALFPSRLPFPYARHWKKVNKKANLDLPSL